MKLRRSNACSMLNTMSLVTALCCCSVAVGQVAKPCYLDVTAGAGGDGESWATAVNSFQDALAVIDSEGDFTELWVRGDTTLNAITDTDFKTFVFTGVPLIYGGFEGTESVPMERDFSGDPHTILSGSFVDPVSGLTEFANNVVTLDPQQSSWIRFDGFRVTGGWAGGDPSFGFGPADGGGVKATGSGINLVNLIITGNRAGADFGPDEAGVTSGFGSGMSVAASVAVLGPGEIQNTIANVEVFSNVAVSAERTTGNQGFGSALFVQASDTNDFYIMNTTVHGNQGFGMPPDSFSVPPLVDAAGAVLGGGPFQVTNCTFYDNMSPIMPGEVPPPLGFGAGLWVGEFIVSGEIIAASNVKLKNSIVYGNETWSNPIIADQQVFGFGGTNTIDYCDIEGDWPLGTGNIDCPPMFSDLRLRLSANSPVREKGNNDDAPKDFGDVDADGIREVELARDLDWGTRIRYANVDMGAFEYMIDCLGDLDGDGDVGLPDLVSLLAQWDMVSPISVSCDGIVSGGADLNGDGIVGFADLTILLGNWGDCALTGTGQSFDPPVEVGDCFQKYGSNAVDLAKCLQAVIDMNSLGNGQ